MASQRDTGLDDAQLARLRQAIADGRRPRVRVTGSQFPVATTGTVAPLVASGEAEIGFQQISEIAHADGIDYVGPLPPDLQLISVFTAGVHTNAPHPDEARALVKFLTTPTAVAVMKKHGLQAA